MISKKTFLIAAGEVPDHAALVGSLVISRTLGCELTEISCEKSSKDWFERLDKKKEIVRLNGDAAMIDSSGISWMETIGSWRLPVLLMVCPTDNGEIPGSASAYTSLCKSLSVPLLGLIQLGSDWQSKKRKLDCLPWLGYIPSEVFSENFDPNKISFESSLIIENVISRIKISDVSLGIDLNL